MAYTRRGFKAGAAATTAPGALTAGATSITCLSLSTWSGATTNGPIGVTINRGQSDEETVTASGISSNTLTGVSALASNHASGATIEHTSSVVDYDEANAHISDTTLDHHTQYQRTDGTRTNTGLQKFTGQPNTTHESNRIDGQVQVYGRGLAVAADSATHQGGSTMGISVSINRAAPAVTINNANASGAILQGYSGSTKVLELKPTGLLDVIPAAGTGGGGLRVGSAVSQPSGTQVANLMLANIGTALTDTPSNGGWLYVESGALKYKGSSGTVTTLGPA